MTEIRTAQDTAPPRFHETFDVVVVGSGSAAGTAALRLAKAGLSVLMLEKTERLGGTSAMSGAGVWIPANHHARAAGIADSEEEALAYLRAASPEGWEAEEPLWASFVEAAPRMLAFVEANTRLRFALTTEPDPMSEREGGKKRGRMVSPGPLSRRLLGPLRKRLRRSTLPHLFTYHEMIGSGIYHHPFRAAAKLAPRLLHRLLTDSRGQGSALMTGLLKGCIDAGCRIETGARATDLILDEKNGAIIGVIVETSGRKRRIEARRGVVLAAGGFDWNTPLREANFKGPLDRLGAPRGNEGDGQLMAERAGAVLDHMDQANVFPCLPTVYEGHPHGLPILFQAEPHAILVDRSAKRFVSECDYNLGEALDRRDPKSGEPLHLPAWLIADRRFLSRSLPFRWYARNEAAWVIKAATLEDLAKRTDLPAEALIATVSRFNEFCRQGRDMDFGRGESFWETKKLGGPAAQLKPIERAPFLAMSFNRSILGTKGGVRTNARGQALRKDASVIPGLYAAGLTMANPIGTRALGAGTTLGPNLTWGFICAETLLRDNR
ncbi:MAG: FAD-dependent oxidoreductase [Hyphomicrobiales bacterium]|nr:FAD-dependent oxidoreductase [Hyphomicrobiales bacterium]MBV9974156.1 FAD-dependent oxidoreductase [Hyphomicrobiales bacterium]